MSAPIPRFIKHHLRHYQINVSLFLPNQIFLTLLHLLVLGEIKLPSYSLTVKPCRKLEAFPCLSPLKFDALMAAFQYFKDRFTDIPDVAYKHSNKFYVGAGQGVLIEGMSKGMACTPLALGRSVFIGLGWKFPLFACYHKVLQQRLV